jgi:hypothetical protein
MDFICFKHHEGTFSQKSSNLGTMLHGPLCSLSRIAKQCMQGRWQNCLFMSTLDIHSAKAQYGAVNTGVGGTVNDDAFLDRSKSCSVCSRRIWQHYYYCQ